VKNKRNNDQMGKSKFTLTLKDETMVELVKKTDQKTLAAGRISVLGE
jgi:hypothetical protein